MLVIVALGREFAGRWFTLLGGASAALVLVGVLSPLDLPAVDTANFFGYVLWSLWLIAFGIVILVRERAPRLRAPGRRPDGGDVVNGGRGRWAALGVLCASLLAIVVDNTIVNVALPTLARDLDAGLSELQWVVDAYTLVFAGLLLLAGALGDRYGRRRTLLVGLAVFGAASAGAAYAGGVDALIAARAVMGAGAAFVMPATLSLLITVFTDAKERAMAVGIWAATAGLGVALGPGGRRVPARPLLVGLDLHRQRAAGGGRDRRGAAAAPRVARPRRATARLDGRRAVGRGAGRARVGGHRGPVGGLDVRPRCSSRARSPRSRWARSWCGSAAPRSRCSTSACSANPRFTAASSTIMVLFFALFGFLFLSTQYLQFVLGYSPLGGRRAGPSLRRGDDRVRAALLAAGRPPRHQARGDRRDAALLGGPRGRGDDHRGRRLRPARASRCVLMGAGMGLAGAPATESIMGSLPPERANIGSAVNDTTRELGGALGVAVIGSIMSSLYAGAAARRRSRLRRRSRAGGRRRRGRGARGVRVRDVAGIARRRGGGRARRRDRLAPSPGARGRGPRRSHRR